MQVLFAVIDDLFQFAYRGIFGVISFTKEDEVKEKQQTIPLPAPMQPVHLQKLQEALPEPKVYADNPFRPGELYFIGDIDTYLYSDPVVAFDTAHSRLGYGAQVLLKKLGGRWAHVLADGTEGWVLKDSLRERSEDIYPQFLYDNVYEAQDPETIKLRACIGDSFGGARAGIPLTGAEYVTYKLYKKKRVIEWQPDGPRIPGTWQVRLRGQHGVHMSVLPKTDSIMEYIVDDTGYLAYVEAVFPDKSIKVSQVGIPDDGQYTERTMMLEEYRELRPVFIEVT